jgi:hypothetical protein
MRRVLLALAFLSCLPVARAEDDLPKQRGAAIDKGVAWLKKAQAGDGSWDDKFVPFTGVGHMKQGTTALAALALLKSGVAPDDPCINKAFDSMASCKLEHCYDAGTVLMAIEARLHWEPPQLDPDDVKGEGTVEKKPAKAGKSFKPSGADLDLAQKCVQFLVKNQGEFGWTYPPAANGFQEDVSNTQYALLGLDAAERLGIDVPKDVYEKAQGLFVSNQEKDGPEVTPFPVPGADLSYKELKKIEKETRDAIKKVEGSFKGKKPGETNAAGHTEDDELRTTGEEAAKKIYKTTSAKLKMNARGWGYAYRKDPKAQGNVNLETKPTGAMTTAGLASLFICKAHLDGTKTYEKAYRGPMDKALRDGAAWMAKNFSVSTNPPGAQHHLYYIYGLERAGILLLVPKFGEHDWYEEGTKELLKDQAADGSWDAGNQGTVGPMCDTCFALLFLARGTTPIVKIPARTATGQGGDAQKPEGPGK